MKTDSESMKGNDMNAWIESISEPVVMSPPDLQISHLDTSMLTPVLGIRVVLLLLTAAFALELGVWEERGFSPDESRLALVTTG